MTQRRALVLVSTWAAAVALLLPQIASAQDKKGQEIGLKLDRAWSGYGGEVNELELILVAGGGKPVKRTLTGKMLEQGAVEKTRTTITWPADLKGTELLTWNHRGSENDQWLYLPSIQRIKRISARGQNGSFMGSEFAFEDLVNVWWIEKYKYKYLRDQQVGPRKTWVVERYPVDRDSSYSKQIVWVDQEYLSPLRIDFYDRKGKLFKTASFGSFKKYGKKWRADRIDMANRQTGKKSSVVWKKRKMGVSIPDEDFASGKLGS